MTYEEALGFLDERIRWGMRPGVERISDLVAALGHPQGSFPVLHVSGTNGKYSVAVMAASILGELGLTVGTYSSPHLESVTERISVAGEPISAEEFGSLVSYLAPYVEIVERDRDDHLTYFETLTALAFEWFFDRAVHAAVLECGLGGEYDATNVADATVAVVTNVSLDHIPEFGEDLAKAALEKAGVIKPGSSVVTGVETPELLEIVRRRAAEREAQPPLVLGHDIEIADRAQAVGGQVISLRTPHGVYRDLFLPQHGAHQAANCALAVGACEAFAGEALALDQVAAGLVSARLPGRLEVAWRRPLIVVDGGHNPAAAAAVKESLVEAFTFERMLCVLGMLDDKLVEQVVSSWAGAAERFFLSAPDSARAADPQRLAGALRAAGVGPERIDLFDRVEDALAEALQAASEEDLVLVFGSFYTAGEARAWLRAQGRLSHP